MISLSSPSSSEVLVDGTVSGADTVDVALSGTDTVGVAISGNDGKVAEREGAAALSMFDPSSSEALVDGTVSAADNVDVAVSGADTVHVAVSCNEGTVTDKDEAVALCAFDPSNLLKYFPTLHTSCMPSGHWYT